MSSETFPYADLEGHLATLDARPATYQFDLERDIPWSRLDEPGVYLPPDYVADLGFDAAALQAVPEAWELFQWAAALLTCEGFVETEKDVIDFLDHHERLLQRRSNQLFSAEELKHVALFRRIGDALRDQRPEWAFEFDRLYVECGADPAAWRVLMSMEEAAVRHGAFWKGTTHFEENTIYMHKRFGSAPGIQPVWRAAHHAHAREEAQHLITDTAHLEALHLDPHVDRVTSSWLASSIAAQFDASFCVRIAERMVADAFPELPFNRGRTVTETAVYRGIFGDEPAYRRTRLALAARRA
jgi:hypothetical protein